MSILDTNIHVHLTTIHIESRVYWIPKKEYYNELHELSTDTLNLLYHMMMIIYKKKNDKICYIRNIAESMNDQLQPIELILYFSTRQKIEINEVIKHFKLLLKGKIIQIRIMNST